MIASAKFLIPFSLLIAAGASLRTTIATPVPRPAIAAVMQEITQPFTETASTVALDNFGGVPTVTPHSTICCQQS